MADYEVLLLLHEKGIELINLRVQQANELGMDIGVAGDETDEFLQVLVGEEFLTPIGQCVFNLLLQPLPELHVFVLGQSEEQEQEQEQEEGWFIKKGEIKNIWSICLA